MIVNRPYLINFPKISDDRGNLTFIQYPDHIPFKIKRAYWVYDIPSGQTLKGNAFKTQEEIIITLSGSVEIYTSDGITEESITLNRPYVGLHIPNMTWRQLRNFSTNTVVLILSSKEFDEKDYIRDYNQFSTLK
ncbi:MAG: sugar 3,4-ketoisomerase [Bacteroidota bacterium]